MNSDNFIAALGQDPSSWAKRWGLTVVKGKCPKCGTPLETTVPFFCGEYRGLRSPRCSCGHFGAPYTLTRDPKFGDLLGPRAKRPRRTSNANVIAFRRKQEP